MKKKILKYTLLVFLILLLVFIIYVVLDYIRVKKQNKQYPYSEIQIKNNQYYYKNELLTGMSYILGNNSDSTSLTIRNGKLMFKDIFINGKKNGVCEWYNDNGTIYRKTTYKNGLQDGLEEIYDDNGKISRRTIYKDDLKNGIEEFYQNGEISMKTPYINDKEEGIVEFYKNGKVYSTNEYKNGVKVVEETNDNSNGQSSGGVFTYETGYRRMKITITPEKWFGWLEDGSGDGNYSGKTIINGKMNGSDLYDENGIEKRGYVSGSTIYYNDPLGEIKLSRR